MRVWPEIPFLQRPFRRKGRRVRILSVDGGGIRGIIAAMVLAEMERCSGKRVAELFDLVAGTSTGALLVLALTTPDEVGRPRYTARDIAAVYKQAGQHVFPHSVWRWLRALGDFAEEKYPATGLEETLEKVFGDVMLSEVLTEALVPAYEIERRIPFFFKRCEARKREDFDFPVKQVTRASAAVPTYFPPAEIPSAGGREHFAFVDGAVIAFNPALCAFVEALALWPEAEDFFLVSLGTGAPTRPLLYEEVKRWGETSWGHNLFSMMCDANADTVDRQLRQLLKAGPDGRQRYHRFQVFLDVDLANMDNASEESIRTLELLAEEMILRNRATLDTLCRRLANEA